MAMVKCKECGKEISNKAKACPSCGAKVKKPIYKKPVLYVLIVILVIVIACAIKINSNLKAHDIEMTIIDNGVSQVVQIDDVENVLKNNEMQFDELYKNKETTFSGKVSDIHGECTRNGLKIAGYFRVNGTIVQVKDDDASILPTLNEGDTVTVKGTINSLFDQVEIYISNTTQQEIIK